MFRHRLALVRFSLIAAAVLVVSIACAPTAALPPSATVPAPIVVPATAPAADAVQTAQPSSPSPSGEKLAAEQVLRFPYYEPQALDPHKRGYDFSLIGVLFENLYAYDEQNNLVPAAAASMPQISPDGLTYTIKLRNGLKFSDGSPLTANDFEWSWKRALHPETGFDYAFTAYPIVGAEAFNTANPAEISPDELQKLSDAVGVRALDEQTLEFKLARPTAWFPSILGLWIGYPLKQSVVEEHGDQWTASGNMVGNGPFILKEWEPDNRIVLEANPNYRLGPPTIQRIELPFVENAQLWLPAYKNDEFDMINFGYTQYPEIKSDAALAPQAIIATQPQTNWILLNTFKPPFDNVLVRQAFSMALDRETLSKTIYHGLNPPAEQLVPEGQPGHYADLKTLEFNPERARELLAEAGYPEGKGLPEIKYTYIGGPGGAPLIEFYQGQFKEHLGVEIKLDPVDEALWYQILLDPEQRSGMMSGAFLQDYPDPQDWYTTLFNSKASALKMWNDSEFDRISDLAEQELVPARREELYHQAAQLLMDAAPVIYTINGAEAWLLKPHVKNCSITPANLYFPCRTSIMDAYIADR